MRSAALVVAVLALVAALPAAANGSETTGRLLVSLDDPGASARAAAAGVARAATARPSGPRVPEVGLVTVRPAAGEDLGAVAARLRADPRVRAVSVERRATPRAASNDPALTDPETSPDAAPGMTVQWWAERTGLFAAWDVTTGAGARVAVIDSGVDGGHPDFAGKIADTVDTDPTVNAPGPLRDDSGHGSHVASLACAAGDDGIGMVGSGRDCELIVAKTDFSDASVVKAIVEATDRGADSIAMAFGTDGGRVPPRALVDALRYAAARDVVLVAAAADTVTDEQGDPANLMQPTGTGPSLSRNFGLSVTAATYSDQRASFAGRGTQISLAAYGTYERGRQPRGLFGAFPANETTFERPAPGPPARKGCACRTSFRGDSRYGYLEGTSMATGIVAGVAGMVRRLNPDLSSSEVVKLMKQSARRPFGVGWTPDLGWGMLDAGAAVQRARRLDRRAPASRLRGPVRTRRRTVRLRWSGRDRGPDGVRVSGIKTYELWRAAPGRRSVRIARTRGTTRRVKVDRAGRWSFFTIAVDRAGNRESRPRRADARVRVLG